MQLLVDNDMKDKTIRKIEIIIEYEILEITSFNRIDFTFCFRSLLAISNKITSVFKFGFSFLFNCFLVAR